MTKSKFLTEDALAVVIMTMTIRRVHLIVNLAGRMVRVCGGAPINADAISTALHSANLAGPMDPACAGVPTFATNLC